MAKRKKKGLWVWIVVIVLIAAGVVVWKMTDKNAVTFSCDAGKTIKATFNEGSNASVDLNLSDGRKLNLVVTASAGGARYANDDESIVFWNTGDTARLEENNAETFSNCSEK